LAIECIALGASTQYGS